MRCAACNGLGHFRGHEDADDCEVCDGTGETTAERIEAHRIMLAEIDAGIDREMGAICGECNATRADCACGLGR